VTCCGEKGVDEKRFDGGVKRKKKSLLYDTFSSLP
jgi:hypothetical protein